MNTTSNIISCFKINSKEEAENVLAMMPVNQGVKKQEVEIQDVKISRYAAGYLLGHPERIVYSELIRPLDELNISHNQIVMPGQNYLVPAIQEFTAEDGIKYPTLPTWYYQVYLISSDFNVLLFKFWSDKILSEKELLEFIQINADWSLAEEYNP